MKRGLIGSFYCACTFFICFIFVPHLLAQPDTPIVVPAVNWYGSVTGIVAATAFAVSGLKRALGNVKKLNAVPTWVYCCIVSFILTVLCVRVFQTLPGTLWEQVYQAVLSAATSSGAYEWFANGAHKTTLAQSAQNAGVPVTNIPT